MGSDAHLIIVGGDEGATARATRRIEQLESRWSRFRADSEVTAVNERSGQPVPVSFDTRLLVARAIEAWRLTRGAFDPTLLDDLIRIGYDRSFEQLDSSNAVRHSVAHRRTLHAWRCPDIVVDDATVTLPAGLTFDPGGIGKGLAADIVATELMAEGVAGVCINIGGDLRVLGASPEGSGWTLAIEHPYARAPIALVGLSGGAIATSSVLRRVWTQDGCGRHHLIDPTTGDPSDSDLALASVIAGEAWTAEVLAKAVLLRGRARAFDVLDASTAAVVVDHNGNVASTDTMSAFLGGCPLTNAIEFDLQETVQ